MKLIKDWIQNKNAQFEILGIDIVVRLKDGLMFYSKCKERVFYKGKLYYVYEFEPDCIHVLLADVKGIKDIKILKVQINDIKTIAQVTQENSELGINIKYKFEN